MVRASLVAAACVAGGCALAQPAGATFPGANGSLLIGAGHCKRGTNCHGITSTYVASPNASSFHRLPGQEPDLSGPFSADGRWVYTVRVEGEATRVYPLRVSNWRLGTPIGPRGRYNWVSPSPDGRRLLVVHVGPSTPEVTSGRQFIEVWSRDGRHRRRLVEGSQPTWSATNQIAYLCQHHQPDGGTLNNVCVIDPAGGNQRQLTATGAEQDSAPSWSPDGRRIVFARATTTAVRCTATRSAAIRALSRPHSKRTRQSACSRQAAIRATTIRSGRPTDARSSTAAAIATSTR